MLALGRQYQCPVKNLQSSRRFVEGPHPTYSISGKKASLMETKASMAVGAVGWTSRICGCCSL